MPHDEFSEMAQKFLDLWQDQMTASFRDPEAAMRNMQLMQSMGQAYFEALSPPRAGGKSENHATAAHAASRSDELPDFGGRIEALERRVALLELAVTGQNAAAKPAKPKTRK